MVMRETKIKPTQRKTAKSKRRKERGGRVAHKKREKSRGGKKRRVFRRWGWGLVVVVWDFTTSLQIVSDRRIVVVMNTLR